jgi:hypothetical protein|nr:MAG TPA_asm: NinB protein [Caudoviricetes sp.]
MRARLHDLAVARDGGWLLTIRTNENVGGLFDELHECDVDVAVKKYRKKRSLDANAYCWVLLDRLAAHYGISKQEVYRQEIRNIGGVSDVLCLREKAADAFCRSWERNGIGWMAETFPSKLKGCVTVTVWYGSSTYDTEQMSRLIDTIVQDCKAAGIETMTPAELDALVSRWGEVSG